MMSQREVARVLGVTYQTVQSIERRALRKMRARLLSIDDDWLPIDVATGGTAEARTKTGTRNADSKTT